MVYGSADRVLLKYLPALYTDGSLAGLTDSELLDRFTRLGGSISERAFEALVERHGPMVLRVCRQVLNDAQDVEDAFQGTFLVLLRRARSIRRRESLASWLHGVALRVARRAKRDATRKRQHEARHTKHLRVLEETVDSHNDWPVLHEEIARLPDRFQEPIVLYYLRGLTTEEAAQRLGCPQGTVLSRLARGRERLRSRLVRRGFGPAFGLLAVTTAPDSLAAVPPALRDATFALAKAGGSSTSAATKALVLAEGVIWTMKLTRWKTLVAVFTILGVTTIGTALLAQQAGKRDPQPVQAPATVGRPSEPTAKGAPLAKGFGSPSGNRTESPETDSVEIVSDMELQLQMDELQLDIEQELFRKAMISLGEAEFERPHDDRAQARKDVEVLRTKVLQSSRDLAQRRRKLGLIAKPGDRLIVEVLEALPGRPLSGERAVRPDGTIGMSFYGEIQVAGLTSRQIKAKVVEHMKRFLDEEALGVVAMSEDGKKIGVEAADSDRVYVEFVQDPTGGNRDRRISDLERKIDELRGELDRLKHGHAR